jgi:hypothetical protein
MTRATAVAVPARPRPTDRATAQATADRRLRRRVETIWILLFVNVLAFGNAGTILPIPHSVGKLITQGALQVALILALLTNRRMLFRTSIFLFLVTLLPLEAVLTLIGNAHLKGTSYRTFRYAEFVAVLWLITPFWGRRDRLLVYSHLKAMAIVLGLVALGLIVSPGSAMSGGRLSGDIWPIPSTQVAHYAAFSIGIVIMLWLNGACSGRKTLFAVIPAGIILLLTHTRTALLGLGIAILVAGLSVILVNARVRKTFINTGILVAIGAGAASGAITSYLTRGQSTQQLNNLTGRTSFWGPLLSFPRNLYQEIFGFGLSNGLFDGHPVDSNWLLSYQDQGIFGDVICGLILIYLLVTSFAMSRRLERSLAVFCVVYCLVASFTEDGFTNASPYTLDLVVAASLLVPVVARKEIITPRL